MRPLSGHPGHHLLRQKTSSSRGAWAPFPCVRVPDVQRVTDRNRANSGKGNENGGVGTPITRLRLIITVRHIALSI